MRPILSPEGGDQVSLMPRTAMTTILVDSFSSSPGLEGWEREESTTGPAGNIIFSGVPDLCIELQIPVPSFEVAPAWMPVRVPNCRNKRYEDQVRNGRYEDAVFSEGRGIAGFEIGGVSGRSFDRTLGCRFLLRKERKQPSRSVRNRGRPGWRSGSFLSMCIEFTSYGPVVGVGDLRRSDQEFQTRPSQTDVIGLKGGMRSSSRMPSPRTESGDPFGRHLCQRLAKVSF